MDGEMKRVSDLNTASIRPSIHPSSGEEELIHIRTHSLSHSFGFLNSDTLFHCYYFRPRVYYRMCETVYLKWRSKITSHQEDAAGLSAH